MVEWVTPESIVYTDEWTSYRGLDQTSTAHSRINHSADRCVDGDVYTNTVERFFGNLKTAIRGNYKKASHKHLQGYLNEYARRYNHCNSARAMFTLLLARAAVGR